MWFNFKKLGELLEIRTHLINQIIKIKQMRYNDVQKWNAITLVLRKKVER